MPTILYGCKPACMSVIAKLQIKFKWIIRKELN